MINKRVVISENMRIEQPRTVRVGQRLIKGAMRIAPTHCAAWLSPCAAPTRKNGDINQVRIKVVERHKNAHLVNVCAVWNRSVARVVMEPLKISRPSL